MPYINGKRVTAQEWQDAYGSIKMLHTGPNGENPAPAAELEEETASPAAKRQRSRSPRSTAGAKAAIANALGVKATDESVAALDVSGLDIALQDDGAAPSDVPQGVVDESGQESE